MEIRSKTEFFQKWKAGLLGNRTNVWYDPEEAWAAPKPSWNHQKEFGFREHRAGGGTWVRVPEEKFWETVREWQAAGRVFTIDDVCPDWHLTFQGEVCRTYRGLEGLLDTTAKLPMRKAANAGHLKPAGGAVTLALIHKFMDPSSQDDLWDLLDLYPDATVEFSCFSVDVGVFPNRNTLFWETRCY